MRLPLLLKRMTVARTAVINELFFVAAVSSYCLYFIANVHLCFPYFNLFLSFQLIYGLSDV